MSDWTMWATFLTLGNAVAILASYLLCRARMEQTYNRILVLEREMSLARMREETNEQKLAKIFDAVTALRETTEDRLANLREKIDELIGGTSRSDVPRTLLD